MQSQRERRARDDAQDDASVADLSGSPSGAICSRPESPAQQLVEQADANATKAIAQRRLNVAQLDQQKAAPAAIDMI